MLSDQAAFITSPKTSLAIYLRGALPALPPPSVYGPERIAKNKVIDIPQLFSSDPSVQSLSPSHFQVFKMHCPSSQVQNSDEHVIGALVVILHDASSVWSVQSLSPSHFHFSGIHRPEPHWKSADEHLVGPRNGAKCSIGDSWMCYSATFLLNLTFSFHFHLILIPLRRVALQPELIYKGPST